MSNISHGQTADMLRWISKCKVTDVNLATDQTVVSAVPAEVLGYWISVVMSAHAVQLSNASTAMITIAASGAAGTYVQFPAAVEFDTSFIIDPNVSSTGHIAFFWRLL